MSHTWGTLQPETVAEYINFDPQNNPLGILPTPESMAETQTEGAAFLWNTLHELGVVLLADEVGMGKTFQALAICCLLWRSKPDARIMVMTPNESICRHWRDEYHTFVRKHYQQTDLRVKSADQTPVHEAKLINDLQELCNPSVTASAFTLAKISSLSYLTKNADKESNLCTVANQEAIRVRESLEQQADGATPFDLVIIDEAQYFRTYGARSQRHHAAQGFFGAEVGHPLADKFLLMTATPSHRSMGDVQNIMRYFAPEIAQLSPSSILDKIALRRLRLLQAGSRGAFNKYQYREERALPADFAGDVDAELFYALYQKKLVQNQRSSGRRYMYGYLEGFESMGRHEADAVSETETADVAGITESKAEYHQAVDSEILADLSSQYYECYRNVPSHPKYRALVNELVVHSSGYWDADRCLLEDKHLVFVRRIPSVNELTQRVNEVYEKLFAGRILNALLPPDTSQVELAGKLQKWQKDNYSRKVYTELYRECRGGADLQADAPDEDDADTGDSDGDDDPNGYKCRVLDIFTTKKNKGQDSTHASRFRLRFGNEMEVFSIFFEPAMDYLDGDYQDFTSKKGKKEYRKYARSVRVEKLNAPLARSILEDVAPYAIESRVDNTCLPTLWSLCVKLLRTCNPVLLATLESLTILEKESFARYVRSGLLFSSSALIEFYSWYIEAAGRHADRPGYEQYVTYIGDHLLGSVTYRLWCEALTTFKIYLEKIRGVTGKHLLGKNIWNCFTRSQQPAWFVHGQTDSGTRENIRFAFNSPFFPNVLIATSVFQEGVNLHLNCRKVNHYGIAASAGDNEQRIGRVDRLFGHINRKLEERQHDRLLISYPFLKGTFDEEQLASFLKTKDEIVSKMDECRQPDVEKYIQQASGEDWSKFLHTPERFRNRQKSADPYPAGRKGWPTVTYQPCDAIASPPFAAITHAFTLACQDIAGVKANIFQYPDPKQFKLFIDVLRLQVGRQQPIIVEGHFHQVLMQLGSSGYYLRLKSPLADREAMQSVEETLLQPLQQLSHRHPLPKLVLDDERQGWFYLHLAVDLPVLMRDEQVLLVKDEIQLALEQLIHLTDELETALFDGFDLGHEQIVELGKLAPASWEVGYSTRTPEQHVLDDGWQPLRSQDNTEQSASLVFRNLDRLFVGDWHTGAIANQKTPFVNHLLFGEENHVGVCFPSVDFQPEEQALLGNVCEEMVTLEGLSDDRNPSIQAIVGLFALLSDHPYQKVARTVWNQAYKQFRTLSVGICPDRSKVRALVEAVAATLGVDVAVSTPFWKGGWATRTDLFGVLETVSEQNAQVGLAIIHYNDGDEPFSIWKVIKKMTDKNLILADMGHDGSLTHHRIRLDRLMVRNDQAELVPNAQRPYQIRPRECLLVGLAG